VFDRGDHGLYGPVGLRTRRFQARLGMNHGQRRFLSELTNLGCPGLPVLKDPQTAGQKWKPRSTCTAPIALGSTPSVCSGARHLGTLLKRDEAEWRYVWCLDQCIGLGRAITTVSSVF